MCMLHHSSVLQFSPIIPFIDYRMIVGVVKTVGVVRSKTWQLAMGNPNEHTNLRNLLMAWILK